MRTVYFNLYYYNKWWYKALTVLMIIVLIVIITVVPVQRAKAIGVLTATMGAAILAVLAGAGVYTVVSGMTWNEISDWITSKLNSWDSYRNDGQTWDELLTSNKVGATVSGFLKVEYELASKICEFATWLVGIDLNMTNNDSKVVVSGISFLPVSTINDYTTYQLCYNNRYYASSVNDTYLFGISGISSRRIYAINVNTFELRCAEYNNPNSINYYRYSPNYNNQLSVYEWTDHFYNSAPYYVDTYSSYEAGVQYYLDNYNNTGSLTLGSDVIGIPDVDTDSSDIIINPGAYPGATTEQVTDVIIDGIVENTLDVNMDVTNEFTDAQAVVVTNTLPISVNTDHHMFGFTLPSFDVNFVSIWHYVHDAITYSSGFIAHIVNFLNSVPVLAIPVYMSFTLMIVLGFLRKVL